MVRVCKAFLPLLKDQAIQQTHVGARIINVVSMAGMIIGGTGGAAYTASKFAASAFSSVLRLEMQDFKIQVSTVNPSFHGTPLVTQMGAGMQRIWKNLDEATQAHYGPAYLQRFTELVVDRPQTVSWKIDAVVDALLNGLESRVIAPEVLVGMDARFALVVLRMLPAWVNDVVDSWVNPRLAPAAMT
jgi:NAD(P)-dependent dehydrogenase (short-subunit alcohol dehydrogenase family)